jgi:hypothetical protein
MKRSQAHKAIIKKMKVQIAVKKRTGIARKPLMVSALPFKPSSLTVEEIRAAIKKVAA